MPGDPIEQLLFKAVQRVAAAEKELELSTAELHGIYDVIAGVGSTGRGDLERRSIEDKFSIRGLGIGRFSASSTLVNDGPRQNVRIRVKEYCRQNSGRCLSAETIARALGTKITTTRYELYQLSKAHIVVKVGVDQWKYVDPEKVQEQMAEPQSAVEAPPELRNGAPTVVASNGKETLDKSAAESNPTVPSPAAGKGATDQRSAVGAPSQPGAERSGTDVMESQISEKDIDIAMASITHDEFDSIRERTVGHLRQDYPTSYPTAQIATQLKISQPLAREALNRLRDERRVRDYRPDQWTYRRNPEDEPPDSASN
jgi:hypothetical protein